MLQQTTVATVRAYFEKFTALWPTVQALADAPLDDVLTAWAGLGYYARARNLHKCAVEIAHHRQGVFPRDEVDLLTLPGVGAYTAAAIAAIAFDQRAVVVDGNVERVISRWYALEDPLPKARPAVKRLTDRVTPAARNSDFPQAMMDLGSGICTPRSPSCLLCPIAEGCQAMEQGRAAAFPKKAPKKPKPTRFGLAYWIENEQGDVLLTRRPDTGLLGGMMEVPGTEWGEVWPDATPVRAAGTHDSRRNRAHLHAFSFARAGGGGASPCDRPSGARDRGEKKGRHVGALKELGSICLTHDHEKNRKARS